ncbi:MAG: NUDIX domain-containing protein [Gemmatimonadetes bacterium]|nr:NUDIX domain-containing protein [Gemmatimonadota bacterium]
MKPADQEETSAGGVVVRHDAGGARVLLIRDACRNWGFPKGHVEAGEAVGAAALREVAEETGLDGLAVRADLGAIDWRFRLRGRPVHKRCHFFLMETARSDTRPLHAEGITACRWATFDDAERLLAYENARAILRLARGLVIPGEGSRRLPPPPAVPGDGACAGAEARDLTRADAGPPGA